MKSFTDKLHFVVLWLTLLSTSYAMADLSAPTNLRATEITDSTILFEWTDNALEEDGYSVLIKTKTGYEDLSGTLPPDTESYLAENLSPFISKKYLVAVTSGGTPELSDILTVKTTHTWSGSLLECFNYVLWNDDKAHIPTKAELESLQVFECSVQGSSLVDIEPVQDLVNIKELVMTGNGIRAIPDWIMDRTGLTKLLLGFNELQGSIPDEIGKLINLKDIGFNGNQLSGSIPAEIGKLVALESLSLNTNNLSGNIPAEIGKLTALKYMFLEENNLSGPIPTEIGKLLDIKRLYLQDNYLSGRIPQTIENLTNLEELDLQHNNLAGEIPTGITNLSLLEDGFGLFLYRNCNLHSEELDVRNFIDVKASEAKGYQRILNSNKYNCPSSALIPVILYLLN